MNTQRMDIENHGGHINAVLHRCGLRRQQIATIHHPLPLFIRDTVPLVTLRKL